MNILNRQAKKPNYNVKQTGHSPGETDHNKDTKSTGHKGAGDNTEVL